MALDYAHGAIQWIGGASGTYTVSGLSFQPKAMRFYCVGLQSETDGSTSNHHSARCVGFAVSTTSRSAVATFDQDNIGSMVCGSGYFTSACVVVLSAATIDGRLDLDAILSDGFRLIIDDVLLLTSSITVFWEAWGGSDITVAEIVSIAEPAATGNVDYTVTGFVAGATDQVVMFGGIQSVSAAETIEGQDSGLCVGFATGGADADNVLVCGNADEGAANADTDGYCKTGECLAMITVAGGNPNARAKLTQFGTDNFRLNWIARGLTNRRYIALAIKGGQWKAGSYTIDGSTLNATAQVSSLPFQPVGLSLIGRMTAEQAAGVSSAEDRLSMGSGSSTTSRRAMGHLSENGTGNAEIDLCIEYDQVLAFPSTAGALLSAYDISAINSDGFTTIVDVAGGVASEWQGYLTFGSAAGGSLLFRPPTDLIAHLLTR